MGKPRARCSKQLWILLESRKQKCWFVYAPFRLISLNPSWLLLFSETCAKKVLLDLSLSLSLSLCHYVVIIYAWQKFTRRKQEFLKGMPWGLPESHNHQGSFNRSSKDGVWRQQLKLLMTRTYVDGWTNAVHLYVLILASSQMLACECDPKTSEAFRSHYIILFGQYMHFRIAKVQGSRDSGPSEIRGAGCCEMCRRGDMRGRATCKLGGLKLVSYTQ